MVWVDQVLLLGAVLVIAGIVSSKLSSRVGVPALVLFLAIGMLAGSEGIGGIEFEDFELAHTVGTVALVLILFDGGLRTSRQAIRRAWKPAAFLATGGVLATALLTGAAAAWILGLPLIYGMLLGSIISSTDAAAIFVTLRKQRLRLEERLSATLEVESASNDPMAVFLTVGVIEVVLGRTEVGVGLLWFFVAQMSIGAIAGVVVGVLGTRVLNRINLDASGLYPVLAGAIGFLAYGLAGTLGGSGFLAVFLAGVVLGNQKVVFRRGILLFHDGAAWVAQIVMFVLLGLLSFPSSVAAVALHGLLIAGVLIFLARPVMIFATMLPFGFDLRELTLLSWVGLKGAVPIILAIYPMMLGVPEGRLLFDVVFFVVLISAVSQGWSLPMLARRLGLERRGDLEPTVTLEITSLHHVDAEIVEYQITPDSRAAGRRIRDLALPEGVVISMIARENRVLPPGGMTRIRPGDYVFVVLHEELRPVVDRVFAGRRTPVAKIPALVEFPLRGETRVGELAEFYGIAMDQDPHLTLDEILRAELGPAPLRGDFIELGTVRLVARGIENGRVVLVGLGIISDEDVGAAAADTNLSSPARDTAASSRDEAASRRGGDADA